MKLLRLTGVWVSLFLITSLSCGCATIFQKNKPEESGILEPQSIVKFGDIPVPVGFNLMLNESYSFDNNGLRVGMLKYRGKADIERVVNFYKEQMAIYNWNLLNVVEYGQRIMNFDRDTETCIITLLPKGRTTIITISVGPKAQRAIQKRKTLK